MALQESKIIQQWPEFVTVALRLKLAPCVFELSPGNLFVLQKGRLRDPLTFSSEEDKGLGASNDLGVSGFAACDQRHKQQGCPDDQDSCVVIISNKLDSPTNTKNKQARRSLETNRWQQGQWRGFGAVLASYPCCSPSCTEQTTPWHFRNSR